MWLDGKPPQQLHAVILSSRGFSRATRTRVSMQWRRVQDDTRVRSPFELRTTVCVQHRHWAILAGRACSMWLVPLGYAAITIYMHYQVSTTQTALRFHGLPKHIQTDHIQHNHPSTLKTTTSSSYTSPTPNIANRQAPGTVIFLIQVSGR